MKLKILICLFLLLATGAAYWHAPGLDFVDRCDDEIYVTGNPFIADGLRLSSLSWALTTFRCANWHPLTWVSHILDCQVYGLNPIGHHITNLLFHVANAILLFVVLSRMTGSLWRSAFVAALFALHPLHVESVAWVAERKDVLSTFFWFLTTYTYLMYVERPGAVRYGLLIASFALGLMAKPMLVSLPIVLLLLDYWPLSRRRPAWWLVREKAPLLMMSLAACVVTLIAQRAGGAVADFRGLQLDVRIANSAVAYVGYILKMLWPSGLAFFYPHPIESLPQWKVVCSIIALAAISIMVMRQRQQRPYLVIGWFWYVITLIPVIGIVQVGGQAMADRYTYVTLTGLFMMVTWGIGDILRQQSGSVRRMAQPAALAILLVLGTGTFFQTQVWRNTFTLSDHAIKVTKDNFVAYDLRGMVLCRQGNERGIEDLERSIEICPTFAFAHLHLGTVLASKHRSREGVEHLLTALRLGLDSSGLRRHLASAYYDLGEPDLAEQECKMALQLDPKCTQACYLLGVIAVKRGRLDEAIEHWNRTSALDPELKEVHEGLATVHACKGDYAEAWREVYRFIARGGRPAREFIAALSACMPDPGGNH